MDGAWDPAEAMQAVADDEFRGYELSAAKRLVAKLPQGHCPWDDIVAEFRLYTLEAVRDYDPTRRAAFTTFLYRHLQIRSLQWFNWSWLKKTQPEGKSIAPFSAYADMFTDAEQQVFDPTRVVENVSVNLEIGELLQSLSESSKRLFVLLASLNDVKLLRAFRSKRVGSQVARLTGIPKSEVERFVAEIKEKVPAFVCSIG